MLREQTRPFRQFPAFTAYFPPSKSAKSPATQEAVPGRRVLFKVAGPRSPLTGLGPGNGLSGGGGEGPWLGYSHLPVPDRITPPSCPPVSISTEKLLVSPVQRNLFRTPHLVPSISTDRFSPLLLLVANRLQQEEPHRHPLTIHASYLASINSPPKSIPHLPQWLLELSSFPGE